MGSKFSEMKNRSNEGNRALESAKEIGRQAVDDARSMSEIANSLPTDVDDEILQAAEMVKEGTRADAEGYMEGIVNPQIEEGKSVLSEASDLGRTQIANNQEVISAFQQMDGIGDFGRGSRSEGVNTAEQSIANFEGAIADNDSSAVAAESEFENQKGTISGLF